MPFCSEWVARPASSFGQRPQAGGGSLLGGRRLLGQFRLGLGQQLFGLPPGLRGDVTGLLAGRGGDPAVCLLGGVDNLGTCSLATSVVDAPVSGASGLGTTGAVGDPSGVVAP